jgi:non-ribosomal peptide synthetase component F
MTSKTGSAPLSFAQQRLWLIDITAPGAATYNVPLFLRWHGRVDCAAFGAALDAVVAQHDVLRTTYQLHDDRPEQVINPPVSVPTDVVGFDAEPDSWTRVQTQAARRAREPFDLAAGPVIRCTIFTGMPDDDAVLLTVHHIAFDGWSMSRLLTDLALVYQAARAGEQPRLPEPEMQYADFAIWDRAAADTPEAQALLSDRLRELVEVEPNLSLAGALPRPPGRRVLRDGDECVRSVPHTLWDKVNTYAARHRLTPFVVLFAGFQVVLKLWSGREEFLIGTITANRSCAKAEDLVGFLVNTVPLRCRPGARWTFRHLCDEVRTEAFRSLTYQRIPFDRLSAAMSGVLGGHAELVDVGFVLQNFPTPDPAVPTAWDQPLILPTGTAKFDLMLTIEERADGALVRLEHDLARYSADVAARITQCFLDVLRAVLDDPELTPHDLTYLGPSPDLRHVHDVPSELSASQEMSGALTASQRVAAELFVTVLSEANDGARELTVEQLGPGSDFFALGGHSMLAITMLRRVEEDHGTMLPARDFLADPTVAGLAAALAAPRQVQRPRKRLVDQAEWCPTTSAQQRFWSIDRLPWLRQAYLVPTVVEFVGEVDPQALHRAVRHVLGRHPALRSRFQLDRKQRTVFYRTDGPDPTVATIDATGWDRDVVRHHVATTCWSGFDLARDVPARAEIVHCADRILLVLVAHHIVCDGWSREVILRQIGQAYQAESGKSPAALPEPVHPAALAGQPDAATVRAHNDAVVAALAGAPTDVALPHDRPRPETQSTVADHVTTTMGGARTARLRAVAAEAGCTTFMLSAALLTVTMARRDGQRDFVFAFPWSDREGADIDDAVGMFVDTLVLRIDLDGAPTWFDVLARARTASMNSFRNSSAQFDAVAAAVHPDRDLSRPPITPVSLTTQDGALQPPYLGPGVRGRMLPLDPLHIKYELELTVVDHQDDLELDLAYATELFDRGTVEGLLRALVIAADHLLDDPKARPLEEM